ncbi:transglycosylase domain-containing protein [Actinocorallia populi]|uniref:transglycosylase domain-containing protein n=1 Tax=Actinocorallia populi TaxID=2079200 RepID=UPI000D08F138|nr:transglycosylase domain-containing protein [Actinocorallia populi]
MVNENEEHPHAEDGAAGTDDDATEATVQQPGIPSRRRGRWLRKISYGVLGVIGAFVVAFAIAYILTPVPSTQQLDAREQLNVFYYADGETVIAQEGTNRQPVPLAEVSESMRQAVISAENRSFYSDPGVSLKGTVRAFWSTVSGTQVQGGSTITQQMVRNYYSGLSQERSIFRKLKEVMVSLKVNRSEDKDWILERYLNTIYFGRQSYSIQAAAQAYFDKDAKDLDPAESAYLAATIQQPSLYQKLTKSNRAQLEERWRYVLDGMVGAGNLTEQEAAKLELPKPVKQKEKNIYQGQVGYMVNVAKKELREEHGVSERRLALGGFKVVTTFRKPLMDAAVKAVQDNVPAGMPREQRVGLSAVDPKTGEVLAFYGGRDYLKEQMSSAFGLRAQAGSGFKPYVLAAALADGKELTHSVDGSTYISSNGHPVTNSGGARYGHLDLVQMTRNSVNTAYVRLAQEIGNSKITDMAESLGIPRSQLTANAADKSETYALGVADVSPTQQAGAYAAFANDGVFHAPHVIKSFTNRSKRTKTVETEGVRVFSKDVAADATYALQQVVTGGTATSAQLYDGRDVAGKTGTTDKGAAVWFNGFIPQMSTSVGIFNSKSPNKPLDLQGYSAYGGVLPAQVWRAFMSEATRNMEAAEFPEPSTYYTYQPPQQPADEPVRPDPGPTDTGEPSDPATPPDEEEPPVEEEPEPLPENPDEDVVLPEEPGPGPEPGPDEPAGEPPFQEEVPQFP